MDGSINGIRSILDGSINGFRGFIETVFMGCLRWISGEFLPSVTNCISSIGLMLASPSVLLLISLSSFIYVCIFNWSEVKSTFGDLISPIREAIVAVFKILSDPKIMLQYAFVVLIVQIFSPSSGSDYYRAHERS